MSDEFLLARDFLARFLGLGGITIGLVCIARHMLA